MIPEDRKQIGLCIMIVMIANIIFAVGLLTIESLKESKRQCKMKKMRSAAVKMVQLRKAAYEM